ncbi:MAG: ATP synthase F1 subunit gamma [Bacteroidales bacterium]|jgi:F-type H+-transporting ATPase subunit gamma|nr:ATP synthase F1 subunit gamma [Bacteroidales bacterium]
MASLKEIRTRITSVQSTQKITSAMKLVSASKLRHAQNSIISFRPYSDKLNQILKNLSSTQISTDHPLFAKREPEKVVIVAITSNRGLCGAFNSNVIKEILRVVNEKYNKQFREGKLKLVCIGKKGIEQLQKSHNILYANESLLDVPVFSEIAQIASDLVHDFCDKKIDRVSIIYNRFVNPATQKIVTENFLPIFSLNDSTITNTITDNYIFEPSQQVLMEDLILKSLKLKLYKALLDSIASEHGARMTSMAKATDNAIEILRELKLKYNNARQAAITNELNEIVSGAEALKN